MQQSAASVLMKLFYKPKKLSLICFSITAFLVVLFNLPFLFADASWLIENEGLLTALHLFLPIGYVALSYFILSYCLLFVENLLLCFFDKLCKNIFSLLSLGYAAVFAILFLSVPKIKPSEVTRIAITVLEDSIYFRKIETMGDISSVYDYWGYIFSFALMFLFLIFAFAIARNANYAKQRKTEMKKQAKMKEINMELGFEYEQCEFFKQVKIPYMKLTQEDGTKGEFEAYCMLIKDGFADEGFIFNREIPKSDGLLTELDLIVIDKKGIVVLENKHYTTRIYGNAASHDLTIITRTGQKKTIYNPIMQNERHVQALKEFLKDRGLYIDDVITPVHSVVVFTAEGNDRTDNIISGIDTTGTKTKICTSQNLAFTVKQLLSNCSSEAEVNASAVREVLSALSVRPKTG